MKVFDMAAWPLPIIWILRYRNISVYAGIIKFLDSQVRAQFGNDRVWIFSQKAVGGGVGSPGADRGCPVSVVRAPARMRTAAVPNNV